MCPGITDVAGVQVMLVVSLPLQPVLAAGLGGTNFLLRTTLARGGVHWVQGPGVTEDREESEQEKEQHLTV